MDGTFPPATLERLAEHELDGVPGLGGLSDLWLAPAGDFLIAVGDDGAVLSGRPVHDADGTLRDVVDIDIRPLPNRGGDRKRDTDAEALARTGAGGWLVALERRHRVLRYPGGPEGPEGKSTPLPLPEAVAALPANGGIEALAVRHDGVLVACAEKAMADGHPCWLRDGDLWRETRYQGSPDFALVGMAALPNGDLLVLERRFSLLGWFENRLALVHAADFDGGDLLTGHDLGPVEPAAGPENLEGVAVRRNGRGGYDVYLIADDNFSPLQRTVLVQYRLLMAKPDA